MTTVRIALAQINPTVGDLAGNTAALRGWVAKAVAAQAHVCVFPELAVTGSPVAGLAAREDFVASSRECLAHLATELQQADLGHIPVIVGYLDEVAGAADSQPQDEQPSGSAGVASCVAMVWHGSVVGHMPLRPLGDDLGRGTSPVGEQPRLLRINDVTIALSPGSALHDEQAWTAVGADVVLALGSQPYVHGKDAALLQRLTGYAKVNECTLAYVNLVGGQGDLIFPGGSLVCDAQGNVQAQSPRFTENLLVCDVEATSTPQPEWDGTHDTEVQQDDKDEAAPEQILHATTGSHDLTALTAQQAPRLDETAALYAALVLAVRDFVRKSGFTSVVLGLSGGIDSALVATIACDALGAENVVGISMPSKYSSPGSREDAAELAERTGLQYLVVPIADLVHPFEDTLGLRGVAAENLQARVRAVVVMGVANEQGYLVLATGNKSEGAVGYCTMYGDTVGGFAPLQDVLKTHVWQLARWRNADAIAHSQKPPIPENSITKAPSAELREDQTDQDSLPPYEVLDDILTRYLSDAPSRTALRHLGFDADVVDHVIGLLESSQWKRQQSAPGPQVSAHPLRALQLPLPSGWHEASCGSQQAR